ncbi:MAG: 4Fe-4S binding protein [Sulfurovum sp.]|nr:4Fe-4S binding protein [Sulfurovum sp.]
MVESIIRDKNDLFKYPVLRFFFKNKHFLLFLRLSIAGLFFYAIYYGFAHTGKENQFTWALFWGIFWALFMVVTLPTLGRVFCGICPHGFIGQYLTKIGLKRAMPKWMKNRFIGLSLLVFGWWGVYYMFPGLFRTPLGTAILFLVMTIVAFTLYLLYNNMDYCKYVCPIGVLTRGYSKLSFTWLGTYKSACSECKTFECATACTHNLKPFTFDNRNSMTDCTLCMDCTNACEAVAFRITKPSFSLFERFKTVKAEVWAFILIVAAIPITMTFHHGLSRSNIADEMIWTKTAHFFEQSISFGSIDSVGLFAFIYALILTVTATVSGMWIAAKILNKPFRETFYNLGYAFAPLFIFGSMAHALESFFVRGSERIAEGFAEAFGFTIDVAPLASRGDSWLHIFGVFKWIAVLWSLWILYKRLKKMDAPKMKKLIAYPFAASLIVFFIGVNLYRGYIFDTYGVKKSMHHGMHHKTEHRSK